MARKCVRVSMFPTKEKLEELIDDFDGWVACPCSECNYAKSHGIALRPTAKNLAAYLANKIAEMHRKHYKVISQATSCYLGVCAPKPGEKPEDCDFDSDYGEKVRFEEISEEEFDKEWQRKVVK